MEDFLTQIPVAATSPYSLVAYGISAVLFILAGSKLRVVQAVLRAIATVPERDRKHVIESITNSVIPETITAEEWIRNNRNRWLFLIVGTVLILISTVAAVAALSPVGPGPRPPIDQAKHATQDFLARIDAGEFDSAYSQMSEGFRENFPREQWLQASRTFRAPLGAVERRLDGSATASEYTLGRPFNAYTYIFVTKFQNLPEPIYELVSLSSPGQPTPWQVTEYRINVPLNSATLQSPRVPSP